MIIFSYLNSKRTTLIQDTAVKFLYDLNFRSIKGLPINNQRQYRCVKNNETFEYERRE